jgi:hypothetical protein
MSWAQRSKAGVDTKHFQEILFSYASKSCQHASRAQNRVAMCYYTPDSFREFD